MLYIEVEFSVTAMDVTIWLSFAVAEEAFFVPSATLADNWTPMDVTGRAKLKSLDSHEYKRNLNNTRSPISDE